MLGRQVFSKKSSEDVGGLMANMQNIKIEDNDEMFCFVDDPGLFEFKEVMRGSDPDDFDAVACPQGWNKSKSPNHENSDDPSIKDFEALDLVPRGFESEDFLDSVSEGDEYLMGHERGGGQLP